MGRIRVRIFGLLAVALLTCLTASQASFAGPKSHRFGQPRAAGNSLTLYVFPSPYGLKWKNPRALAWSALRNSLAFRHHVNHSIGHVDVELDCESPTDANQRIHTFSGMTTDNSDADRTTEAALLRQGYGLGILTESFPGRIESASDVLPQLPKRFRFGDISLLSFEISPTTCQRLLQYQDEYRQRGFGANYGLPNRPRYGEGAGCSAYATSFLEVAGLLTEEFHQAWKRSLRIPAEQIGGPTTGRHVALSEILFDPFSAWARAEEVHQDVPAWDPDLMHRWIVETFNRKDPRFNRFKQIKAKGLWADARLVPTPTVPLFFELAPQPMKGKP